MPLITNVTSAWSTAVTLTTDEVWQARRGGVFLSTAATPAAGDGLLLREGTALQIASGRAVRVRTESAEGAVIAREAI
ncbi:MAG: hypothetical protein MUF73_02160 [Rhodobacteraceae bacterium]|jgi:hypothetical protein|nr:hypothetical protein [Paracoccaceae bacterium]